MDSVIDKNKFVRVEGTTFILDGKPYRFIGNNFWHAAYLGANLVPGGKERLVRELDQLKKSGITNLRIMASSEESEMIMSVTPAFQVSPGVYNEKLFIGLDFVLDEMSKRNMKAVLVLNNYWQWSGGMAQYVSWSSGANIIDPDLTGRFWEFMHLSGSFYDDKKAMTMFNNYIIYITERINTINGVAYANDPSIMAWELANEPRPHPKAAEDSILFANYYNWIDSTAKLIHSLAPFQLVTTGNEGRMGSLYKGEYYINTHSFSSIDYATFHIWPKNWRWYDAKTPDSTYSHTISKTFGYIGEHIAYARAMNKPIVLEEFGFERDSGFFARPVPVKLRDHYYDTVFNAIYDSAMADTPLVGANFWTWGGEGKAVNDKNEWKPGTDFTGDPPQEAQGLNSIFSSDSSTLNIIKKYAVNLSGL